MILNDPHNSHHNYGKENAYVGQECNAISYDNKVQNTTGRYKTFLKLEYKWRGKNFDSKTV